MDESVEVFLASPDSPERYAHFIINARGTVYDELCFDVGWNTEITVATRTDAQGWTAEIAIPWKSLPFDVDLNATDEPLLRLNLGRNHHQRGEGGGEPLGMVADLRLVPQHATVRRGDAAAGKHSGQERDASLLRR
jgi:hypothetical protein